MAPLPREFREELKRAHPGLTDEMIDEYNSLVSQIFSIDPSRFTDEVEKAKRRAGEFVTEHMPRYDECWKAYLERARAAEERRELTPEEKERLKIKEIALSDPRVQELIKRRLEKFPQEEPLDVMVGKTGEGTPIVKIALKDQSGYLVKVDLTRSMVIDIAPIKRRR